MILSVLSLTALAREARQDDLGNLQWLRVKFFFEWDSVAA
jgi:hypothetical protein